MGFQKGQSGNPKGRPPGIANQAKLRNAIAKETPEIIDALLDRARTGDVAAAKLLLDRTLPPLKPVDQAVRLPIGGGLAEFGRCVLTGLGNGEVTPDQASRILTALGSLARVIETDDLEQRLEKLEQRHAEAN